MKRRIAEGTPRQFYRAVTQGRVARFLDHHSEYESADIAQVLSDDFHQAVTYGDIDMAVKAAHAAAEILNRLGKREQAIVLQIDLLRLQIGTAGTAEEYAAIRRSALAVGSRAQDEGLLAAQAECWLLAADGAHRLASTTRPGEHEDHLIAGLRDLADVAELLAEWPLNEPLHRHRARLAEMLATVSADAYATQWSEASLLGLRALLKRAARAARWMIPHEFLAEIYSDARDAKLAEERLLRLFREIEN